MDHWLDRCGAARGRGVAQRVHQQVEVEHAGLRCGGDGEAHHAEERAEPRPSAEPLPAGDDTRQIGALEVRRAEGCEGQSDGVLGRGGCIIDTTCSRGSRASRMYRNDCAAGTSACALCQRHERAMSQRVLLARPDSSTHTCARIHMKPQYACSSGDSADL